MQLSVNFMKCIHTNPQIKLIKLSIMSKNMCKIKIIMFKKIKIIRIIPNINTIMILKEAIVCSLLYPKKMKNKPKRFKIAKKFNICKIKILITRLIIIICKLLIIILAILQLFNSLSM
jgi:hypothetical protein